jgi:hypothetical protein
VQDLAGGRVRQADHVVGAGGRQGLPVRRQRDVKWRVRGQRDGPALLARAQVVKGEPLAPVQGDGFAVGGEAVAGEASAPVAGPAPGRLARGDVVERDGLVAVPNEQLAVRGDGEDLGAAGQRRRQRQGGQAV